MSARTVADVLVDAHQRIATLERLLADAKDDASCTFALAQQLHGYSAGDISRLLGPAVRPEQVSHQINVGRRLLRKRREVA